MSFAAARPIETVSITVSQLTALQDQLARLERENRLLHEKVHYLVHQRFGRSGEHDNPNQGVFFELAANVKYRGIRRGRSIYPR